MKPFAILTRYLEFQRENKANMFLIETKRDLCHAWLFSFTFGEKNHAWLSCFTFGEKPRRGYLASLLEKKTSRGYFALCGLCLCPSAE